MQETQVRTYPANNQRAFDRERAELESQGWEVASIDYREPRSGCSLPLIGIMVYRPASTLMVTYRKRAS